MRYCKYFIAKFNEAAALHLDLSDICVVGCDESDHRTSESLSGNGQVRAHTAADAHFKLRVDRQYDARMTSSVGRQLRRGALRLNLCQFAGSSPRGQNSPEPTEPQTSKILMHRGGRSSLPYTSKQTSSSPLSGRLFFLLFVHFSMKSGEQRQLITLWLLITADSMSSPFGNGRWR